MLEILYNLVQDIEDIPGIQFYTLERNLYYLKENIRSYLDCDILETYTNACIKKAISLRKRNLELLLKGHQLENIYCRIRQDYDDFSPESRDNLLERLNNRIKELQKEVDEAVPDLIDNCKLAKNFTLCKLFVFIANGYTNLEKFDKAKECLERCKREKWVQELKTSEDEVDENRNLMRRVHIAYYHYGWGRHYRECLSHSTDDEHEIPTDYQSNAIYHFQKCHEEFSKIYEKSEIHLDELILNELHLVRVYLDIRRAKKHVRKTTTLPKEHVEHAENLLESATAKYEKLASQDRKCRRQRVDIRLSWYNSVLFWRLYQFGHDLPKSVTSRTLRNFLLQRVVFYTKQAISKLEGTGYNEKKDLENFEEYIHTLLPSPPAEAMSCSDETEEIDLHEVSYKCTEGKAADADVCTDNDDTDSLTNISEVMSQNTDNM